MKSLGLSHLSYPFKRRFASLLCNFSKVKLPYWLFLSGIYPFPLFSPDSVRISVLFLQSTPFSRFLRDLSMFFPWCVLPIGGTALFLFHFFPLHAPLAPVMSSGFLGQSFGGFLCLLLWVGSREPSMRGTVFPMGKPLAHTSPLLGVVELGTLPFSTNLHVPLAPPPRLALVASMIACFFFIEGSFGFEPFLHGVSFSDLRISIGGPPLRMAF